MFEEDDIGEESLRELAREVRVPILFGSDQVDRSGETLRLYNAAFLVTPTARPRRSTARCTWCRSASTFPFKQLLYFVSPLVERLAEFAPGASMVVLPVG